MDLLKEINEISKIHPLDRDDIEEIMLEFARRITCALKIERMSVWLLNEENTQLTSLAEYDTSTNELTSETILMESDYPTYFESIRKNNILLCPNLQTHESLKELYGTYTKPNDIISLMDIPLRIEGKLIGVMCFEKKGIDERNFSADEQVFALSIGTVFASNLEARHRRKLQFQLEKQLLEKETLIREINHRVKNNFAIVSSMIGLQARKAKDAYHENLMLECRTKIISIADVHEIIYLNNSFSNINTTLYLSKLAKQLHEFFQIDSQTINLTLSIEELDFEIETLIPLALILNEVITNSYKHGFKNLSTGEITITLYQDKISNHFIISDNGSGMQSAFTDDMLGIEIIKALVEQLQGEYSYDGNDGATFKMSFPIQL